MPAERYAIILQLREGFQAIDGNQHVECLLNGAEPYNAWVTHNTPPHIMQLLGHRLAPRMGNVLELDNVHNPVLVRDLERDK